MLYLVGLGLGDKRDITLRGLETVKKCKQVYLENYTAILSGTTAEELSEFYGRTVILADRTLIESGCDEFLELARTDDVCVLVIGDPLCATTHTDLVLRAKQKGVGVAQVVHNASIMNSVAVCGLQLYNFGLTVSVPFWTDRWKPDSFYDKIKRNRMANMHTLCLLDIRVKEISEENLIKGLEIYDPPRFMKVSECIDQLLAIEESRGEGVLSGDTMAVGLARVGHPSQKIVYASLSDLTTLDFGPPLHSLVIPGHETHEMEIEVLESLYSLESLKKDEEESLSQQCSAECSSSLDTSDLSRHTGEEDRKDHASQASDSMSDAKLVISMEPGNDEEVSDEDLQRSFELGRQQGFKDALELLLSEQSKFTYTLREKIEELTSESKERAKVK